MSTETQRITATQQFSKTVTHNTNTLTANLSTANNAFVNSRSTKSFESVTRVQSTNGANAISTETHDRCMVDVDRREFDSNSVEPTAHSLTMAVDEVNDDSSESEMEPESEPLNDDDEDDCDDGCDDEDDENDEEKHAENNGNGNNNNGENSSEHNERGNGRDGSRNEHRNGQQQQTNKGSHRTHVSDDDGDNATAVETNEIAAIAIPNASNAFSTGASVAEKRPTTGLKVLSNVQVMPSTILNVNALKPQKREPIVLNDMLIVGAGPSISQAPINRKKSLLKSYTDPNHGEPTPSPTRQSEVGFSIIFCMFTIQRDCTQKKRIGKFDINFGKLVVLP